MHNFIHCDSLLTIFCWKWSSFYPKFCVWKSSRYWSSYMAHTKLCTSLKLPSRQQEIMFINLVWLRTCLFVHAVTNETTITVAICHLSLDMGEPRGYKSPANFTGKFPKYFYICRPHLKSPWPPCQKWWLDEFEVLWAFWVVLLCKDDVSTSAEDVCHHYYFQ